MRPAAILAPSAKPVMRRTIDRLADFRVASVAHSGFRSDARNCFRDFSLLHGAQL
jgi:hypothetical protein